MNTGKAAKGPAILCLTKQGASLAVKLAGMMDEAAVFIPLRLKGEGFNVYYFEDWQETFSAVFKRYSQVICIMAAGIVVRSLGPLMQSKFSDPAVVVLDEKGRYAISLLSGHIGGANRLAEEVALKLGAMPVITTATDVSQRPAVDLLAARLDGFIEPVAQLKVFNRMLAEGERVYLYSLLPLTKEITEGFEYRGWPAAQGGASGYQDLQFEPPAVIIAPVSSRYVQGKENALNIFIKPKNLVVGMGCRKGVSLEQVKSAFKSIMEEYFLDERCVKLLATIDIKEHEPAFRKFSKELDMPLVTYTKEEINALEGSFLHSDWVNNKIGVGGVCEPAAKLGAKQGMTIVPKQKIGPVTISVAAEKSWWWG